MTALPLPTRGGTVGALRSYLNVNDDGEFNLIVAYVLAALRGRGPFPVLVLVGEQGTSKSTVVRFVRSLIDPSTAPLQAPPTSTKDLFIAARNSYVLALDNMSKLSPELSDSLARLSTGGGTRTRQLFTDVDEVIVNVARPMILNGIEDSVTRPDLQDRSIIIGLKPLSPSARRSEGSLNAEFIAERATIFGALLDAVAAGVKALPHTRLATLPRMADCALWAVACGIVDFPELLESNAMQAIQVLLEADPLAASIRALVATKPAWSGTATDLLNALAEMGVKEESVSALSGKLRRLAPHLRKVGVDVRFLPRKTNTRLIEITDTASSPSSAPHPNDVNDGDDADLREDGRKH